MVVRVTRADRLRQIRRAQTAPTHLTSTFALPTALENDCTELLRIAGDGLDEAPLRELVLNPHLPLAALLCDQRSGPPPRLRFGRAATGGVTLVNLAPDDPAPWRVRDQERENRQARAGLDHGEVRDDED